MPSLKQTDSPDGTVLELFWKGPFQLPGDLFARSRNPIPSEKGVYIWTIPIDKQFFVHYVGYASILSKRQYEHVVYTLGGGYRLPNLTETGQNGWIPPNIDPKLTSWDQARARLDWFVKNDSKARALARQYLMSVRVFVAVTDDGKDAEYMIQKKFRELAGEEASRFCPDISMQGSKNSGRFHSIINHFMSMEAVIPGLND